MEKEARKVFCLLLFKISSISISKMIKGNSLTINTKFQGYHTIKILEERDINDLSFE